MLAMMLDRPNAFRVTEVPDPIPGPGQALLKIISAGICASDMATVHGVSPIAAYPLIPGHECTAQVVSAPAGSGYQQGDKVTVFPTVGCGHCAACRDGRTNHCPTFKVLGIGLPGGCFAEYMAVDIDQLVRLPDRIYERVGALIEPLAVGMHIAKRARLNGGETALVIGTGTIGLASGFVARALGAKRVIMVDRFESRREVARRFGFTDFTTLRGDALAAWVKDAVGPIDVVLDNVTTSETVDLATKVLTPGGRSVLIGLPHDGHPLDLPFSLAYRKELSFVFARNYVKQDFIDTVELLEKNEFDPSPMVTGTYPLSKMADALTALDERPEQHIKVLVKP